MKVFYQFKTNKNYDRKIEFTILKCKMSIQTSWTTKIRDSNHTHKIKIFYLTSVQNHQLYHDNIFIY